MTRALLLVDWIDSHSGRGWQPLDELAKAALVMKCRSVGWFVARKNGFTVLAPHLSGGHDNLAEYGSGDIAIPTKCITRVTRLKEPR